MAPLTLIQGEPDPQRRAEARRQHQGERSLLIDFLTPRALGAVEDRHAQGARWLLGQVQAATLREGA